MTPLVSSLTVRPKIYSYFRFNDYKPINTYYTHTHGRQQHCVVLALTDSRVQITPHVRSDARTGVNIYAYCIEKHRT